MFMLQGCSWFAGFILSCKFPALLLCIGKKKQIWKKSSFSDIKAKSSFSHKTGFQKHKDTFLNPSIQASLSAKKKQLHNQYDGLLCFARKGLRRESNFSVFHVMSMDCRQKIAASKILVASTLLMFF